MIVPMKKVFLLCMEAHKDETLAELRELGIVHVTSVKPPAGKDLDAVRDQITVAQRALTLLQPLAKEMDGAPGADADAQAPVEQVAALVNDLAHQRDRMTDAIRELRGEIERTQPFGDFDPQRLAQLAEQGIIVRFYQTLAKNPVQAPAGTVYTEFHRQGPRLWFALSGPAEAFEPEPTFEPLSTPQRSLSDLRAQLAEQERERDDLTRKLLALTGRMGDIEAWSGRLAEDNRFWEVKSGMGESGAVAFLEGYCPDPFVHRLEDKAAVRGWGLVIREPDAESQPPTLVHYPKWVYPIKAAFEVLEIFPGYREADISVAFLFFFSLFFAMIIGDAGYGLVFLGLTGVGRLLMRKAPAYPFVLLTLLSSGAVIWGVLTGNVFGVTQWPSPLDGVVIQWLRNDSNVMEMCFFIGAIHLTLAHIWNAVQVWPQLYALAQVGWAMLTWTMFLLAREMILQRPAPWNLHLILFGIGIVLIILFTNPWRLEVIKREWIKYAMLPLNVVSNFVDVVSYVRLFAVSMASLMVARSFNQMAIESIGFDGLLLGFAAALVLFLGHALNITLCVLSVLVHGVRLNTLEFSTHKEMQWSGFPYSPFKRGQSE